MKNTWLQQLVLQILLVHEAHRLIAPVTLVSFLLTTMKEIYNLDLPSMKKLGKHIIEDSRHRTLAINQ